MDIQPFTSVSADQYELLLMADPSRSMIASYVNRAFKFATEIDNQLVGVILLLPTHPQTLEIVNLAVSKCHQNHVLVPNYYNLPQLGRKKGTTTLSK